MPHPWNPSEDLPLLNFLIEKSEDAISELCVRQISREFIRRTGTDRPQFGIEKRIAKFRTEIHDLEYLDEETKNRLTMALRPPERNVYKNPKVALWTEEEHTELVSFLVEKSMNAVLPLVVSHVATQFKARSNTHRSTESVRKRIKLIRSEIDMYNMDPYTKEKIIGAFSKPRKQNDMEAFLNFKPENWSIEEHNQLVKFLGENPFQSPIDITQLSKVFKREANSIRPIASIHYRIRRFRLETYGPENLDLELIQVPKLSKISSALLNFLAEIAENRESPMEDFQFLIEFRKRTGFGEEQGIDFYAEYQTAKKSIFNSLQYDLFTRIKMMFVSNLQIDTKTLKSLRENAIVELDYEGHIGLYISSDRSLHLERNFKSDNSRKRTMTSSDMENLKMLKIDSEGMSDEVKEEEEVEFEDVV